MRNGNMLWKRMVLFVWSRFNKREKKSSIWIKNTAVKQENGAKHSTLPVNNSTVKTV